MPDSGLLEARIDFGPDFLDLAIDKLADPMASVTARREPLQIPWKLEIGGHVDGKTIEGKLPIELDRGRAFNGWLRGLITAKQRPAFKPTAGLTLVLDPNDHVLASEEHHKVSDFAVIVVGTEANKHDHGTCEYVNDKTGAKFTMARVDFDATLQVLDTATGAVTTPKPVPAGDCPMFATRTVDRNGNSTGIDMVYVKPDAREILNALKQPTGPGADKIDADKIGAEMLAVFARVAAEVKATKASCAKLGRKLVSLKAELARIVASSKGLDKQALADFEERYGKQVDAALAPARAGLTRCRKDRNVKAFLAAGP